MSGELIWKLSGVIEQAMPYASGVGGDFDYVQPRPEAWSLERASVRRLPTIGLHHRLRRNH
jgi:hypothetical protein